MLCTCSFRSNVICLSFFCVSSVDDCRSFKWSFSEGNLFKKEPEIAQEFAEHFKNITSNIMDCVACEKCRLWGKIQIHGVGTAFKILTHEERLPIHLTRHEITSLVNAITKHSRSILFLEEFDRLIQSQSSSSSPSPSSLSTGKKLPVGQIPAFF